MELVKRFFLWTESGYGKLYMILAGIGHKNLYI